MTFSFTWMKFSCGITRGSKTNHEVLFHAFGVASMLILFPLLFFFHRDEDNTESVPLEELIYSVDFKVMVYVSIAAAFPLTADLIIDSCTTKDFSKTKQMIPRVAICGNLLGTAFLHLYFTFYLGSVYATWVIMNMRSVMTCAVLLHQCQIRCGHVVTPAFSYVIMFFWNVGSIIKCYGGNYSTTLMMGQYMRYAALVLAMWGLIDHVRMHFRGKLKDWRSKWHRTCFELLLLLVVSIGTLSTVLGQQDELYDLSPMTMLILSYDTILFLVMMSIIITNEFRHEHAQAQVQLEVKRMFVKYVSHEVRTPLNSCMLGIQYMKEAILHPTKECVQEIAGILDEVSEGCSTAIDFMNNLLLYEKIDSMDLPLYLKREDLSKVCTEVLQSFKMSARQLGINLKLHIHNTLEVPGMLQNINNDKFSELLTANVEIDGPKILIVLRNLMSNALKFTPEDGEVSLSVTPICLPTYENHTGKRQDPRKVGNIIPKCPLKDTTHFRVILSDSGRGMALDEQLQLFTKIVQFSPNENQKGGGSGIGLFLSHHIMKDHKLDIQVFSEGIVGCGTHFFIDFPRMLTADEKLSHIETSGNFDEDKKCMSSPDSDSTAKSPQSLISHSLQSIISRNHHAKITAESLGSLNHPSTHGDANTPPIEVENENEGAVDHLIADSGVSSKSARGRDKSDMVDPFRQKHSSTMLSKIFVPRSQSFGPTTNKRLEDLSVLVVDDSALNRKMLIRILKQHHIGSSYEGLSDGMMLVKELSVKSDLINNSKNFAKKGDESVRKYDVILLDDHMIDMDGSEAIRILRRAGYDGLVVGLTGSAMDKDLNAFCAAGVDYALPKPFVVDDFIHILRCSFSM